MVALGICRSTALLSGVALAIVASNAQAQGATVRLGDDTTLYRPASYQLNDTTLSEPQMLVPNTQFRLEATAALAPRHELRFSTLARLQGGLASLPGVSMATLYSDASLRLDPTRATYRYTVLNSPDWAWKVGLSANIREFSDALRPGSTPSERFRFGALPLLHVAGEGRLATRWRLSLDADGLMTARGRAFDLGLRVNYSLTPNFLVFGGYRLTESAGDAEEFYGSGLSNAANVGLRYRF